MTNMDHGEQRRGASEPRLRPLGGTASRAALALLLAGLAFSAVAGCAAKSSSQAVAASGQRVANRGVGAAPRSLPPQSSEMAYDGLPATDRAAREVAAAGPASEQGGQPAMAAPVPTTAGGRDADFRSVVLPPSGTRLTQQKIIKNAELSLEVKDVAEAIRQVERAADTAFGFVTDSQMSGSEASQGKGERRAALTVRVPGDQFGKFLERVQEFGKLLNHRVFTEDVSGQFVDLEARQQSALQHEKRLLDIMARGNTVDELLKLENELNRVRAEIEALTGRLNLLRDRVDYSTVRLTLIEPAAGASPGEPQPKTVWQQAIAAFVESAKAIRDFAAALVVFAFGFAPIGLAIGAVAMAAWPLFRRLRGPAPRLATAAPTERPGGDS